jgi:hypothetical protein
LTWFLAIFSPFSCLSKDTILWSFYTNCCSTNFLNFSSVRSCSSREILKALRVPNQRHPLSLSTTHQTICCYYLQSFPLYFSRILYSFAFHFSSLKSFHYSSLTISNGFFTKPLEIIKYWLLGFYMAN